MTLGIDVGGTFTDVVSWDHGSLRIHKTPSTPGDQSQGVVVGCDAVSGKHPADLLVHGTTVATNALLERAGAGVVLITDGGFVDLIEIGRQARSSLYDPFDDRPDPLVPRSRRLPASALSSESGWRLPDDGQAVAVGMLGAFADGHGELEVAEAIRASHPDLPVVLSHRVSGEFREFERINTTILSAYLGPVVASYLDRLQGQIVPQRAERVLVMRSSGGLVPPAEAAANAASILLSGPAGGVVAAARLGSELGYSRVISFDMGGTSTDVCRIENGVPEIGFERVIAGQVCRMPSTAVHTVGAGGGSMGWVDPGGSLRVGPQSAGAVPGPASYGRGGTAFTVTDANVVAGRLGENASLAGGLRLDGGGARAAAERLGQRVGLDPDETALGVVRVVESHMERAIRAVSVEQGADPREAVLIAFGGAGGLHAVPLARRLGMSGVVIPPAAGVFSALGLLLAKPRLDRARSVLLGEGSAGELDIAVENLAADVASEFERALGVTPHETSIKVDARYHGQSHETTVPYRAGEGWEVLSSRFHEAHRTRNGFSRPGTPVEAVTIRAMALGEAKVDWSQIPVTPTSAAGNAAGRRDVLTDDGWLSARVVKRSQLSPSATLIGPAIVEEGEATTYLPAGATASVHPSGAIEVTW